MMTHTPGPWTYVRNPENTRWVIDSEPNHAIACTAGHECANEANARLIAAAPELLAALHKIADLGTCGGRGGFQKALDIAVSAICKATRGAS